MARKVIKYHDSEIKNIVRSVSLLADAGASTLVVAIAEAVDDVSVGNVEQVRTGNYVQAINFEINFNFEGNITAVIDWYIWKNLAGVMTRVNPAITGTVTDDSRRYRLLEGMEMPAGINNSGAVKRMGTILVPKHLQRMGKADKFEFVWRASATGGVTDVCAKFIYKSKKP